MGLVSTVQQHESDLLLKREIKWKPGRETVEALTIKTQGVRPEWDKVTL